MEYAQLNCQFTFLAFCIYLCFQVLADICSEDWVREKFLHDPEELLKREQLLDPLLKPQEVRQNQLLPT